MQLVILPNLKKTLSKTLFPTASGHTILFSFKGILQYTLLPVGKAAGSQGLELNRQQVATPLALPQLLQEYTSGDKSLCGRVSPRSEDYEGNKERPLACLRERCSHKKLIQDKKKQRK